MEDRRVETDGPEEMLPGALCPGGQTSQHQPGSEPRDLGILAGHWALAGNTTRWAECPSQGPDSTG